MKPIIPIYVLCVSSEKTIITSGPDRISKEYEIFTLALSSRRIGKEMIVSKIGMFPKIICVAKINALILSVEELSFMEFVELNPYSIPVYCDL